MTSLLEFFYDGRKIFMALILGLLFLIVFFVLKQEIIPYNVFFSLFSKYFEELHPISFLIFYYFIVAYIISSLIIVVYDLIIIFIKRRRKK
ncbi:MAG: hypothetical protein GTN40_04725 [Candidatus Aenigmarchaeota archaeon]|nr:hypothetical protein [Candidatus Aenigmarchaeota archaeon]